MIRNEAIITVVGFLGAGKTTFLKRLVSSYVDLGWNPFVILNDYENAYLDSQQFIGQIESKSVWPMNGNCICCSGINELRDCVNRIPERENGVTLIEANGTSDACSLMGFLGVGLNERFLPPIQVSVVDVRNWQKRGEYNDLEANQIQVSSLIVLSHIHGVEMDRLDFVIKEIGALNPSAQVFRMDEVDALLLPKLLPSKNKGAKLDHLKAHWASSSIDLPEIPTTSCIYDICGTLPKTILRVKGCVRIDGGAGYTYFERTPDGVVTIRSYNGVPITGPKLVAIGPGSEQSLLENIVRNSIAGDGEIQR